MEEQTQNSNTEKVPVYKNKIILIIAGITVIILTTVVALFLISLQNRSAENLPTPVVEEDLPKKPTALLYFENPAIEAQANTPVSTHIKINTEGEFVSGTIISVNFDPVLVSNVSLIQVRDPNSSLSNAFEDATGEVDMENGVAWIVLKMNENTPDQPGSGIVARLNFTPSASTILTFGGNSAFVTRLAQEPILANTSTLEVIVTNPVPQQ